MNAPNAAARHRPGFHQCLAGRVINPGPVAMQSPRENNSASDASRISEAAIRFEGLWRSGPRPDLADYLATNDMPTAHFDGGTFCLL